MSYVTIENFAGGVDRSRPIYALADGSLWDGVNGHLTRGGDFEKRKTFQWFGNLPADTFGLIAANVPSGTFDIPTCLWTFTSNAGYGAGSVASFSLTAQGGGATFTVYVFAQRLAHPSGLAMARLISADIFDGKIYAVAEYSDGSVYHFYDGVRITDWTAGGTGNPVANGPVGSAAGTVAKTYKRRVYSAAKSILYFSSLDRADKWNSTNATYPGAGFINMQTHAAESDVVTAMAIYRDQLAVFSRRVIQLWKMDSNAANNAQQQVIIETGTRSPMACRSFGDFDVFYLSDSGIRSLRALQYSVTAGVVDVGTPIDPLVRDAMTGLTNQQIADACAVVEPVDGRFWLAVGTRIFVFSYFPSKKISAWTVYEPGFTPKAFATILDRIIARGSDNGMYVYGGVDNAQYGLYTVTVQLPFISARKPATFKECIGFDIAASGDWASTLLMNPEDLSQYVDFGVMTGFTYPDPNVGGVGYGTHVAPKLVNSSSGYCSLSKVTVHFLGGDQE